MAPTAPDGEKRGRGRPRKDPSERKSKPYVPTGRPRGRPKGSGGVKKSTTPRKPAKPTFNADGTPRRGRGRPRKSDALGTPGEEAKSGAAATPKRGARKSTGGDEKGGSSKKATNPKKGGPKASRAKNAPVEAEAEDEAELDEDGDAEADALGEFDEPNGNDAPANDDEEDDAAAEDDYE